MKILINEPTVIQEFEFSDTSFDIFHSMCTVDDVDYTFTRNVRYQQWVDTKVAVNGQLLSAGEDPRAFDLLGTPACYSVRFNEWERFVPQLFLKSDDDWICLKIKMGNNTSAGKNWSPFVYNNEVYFVHEISPFRVLKLNGDTVTTEFVKDMSAPNMPIDNYPVLRGGCNGLDIGNGIVLGFGHDNHATGGIDSIKHRPYAWALDMNSQSVELIESSAEWDNKYNIIDPTAFIVKNNEYFLMTCETESQWKRSSQTGRSCLYPISITR
jgi:hypothetical protein